MRFRSRGFTLLELLVVVGIIAILSVIVIVLVNSARSKSRDAKRMQDVKQINIAINLYQNDHGGAPPSLGSSACLSLTTYNSSCFASSGIGLTNWNILQTQLEPYLSILPSDPCPTCTADLFNNLKAYADTGDFEYVYHAPAMVGAYLTSKGINPITAGIASMPYSIYAKRLEKTKQSFGFGLSLPSASDLVVPATDQAECPYEEGGQLCSIWILCNDGDSNACEWLEHWQACEEGNQESCEFINPPIESSSCPWQNHPDQEKICEQWQSCESGNEESCKWISENTGCPYQYEENGEQMCKTWEECFISGNQDACNELP